MYIALVFIGGLPLPSFLLNLNIHFTTMRPIRQQKNQISTAISVCRLQTITFLCRKDLYLFCRLLSGLSFPPLNQPNIPQKSFLRKIKTMIYYRVNCLFHTIFSAPSPCGSTFFYTVNKNFKKTIDFRYYIVYNKNKM